jgi:hypothetical protein
MSYKYLMEGVAGKVTIRATAVSEDDPARQTNSKDPKTYFGAPISNLKKKFGGKDEGYLTDPFKGDKHFFSLKPWQHYDPDTTFLIIDYIWTPDKKTKTP